MLILLTNNKDPNTVCKLVSATIVSSSSEKNLNLPPQMQRGTYGGYGTDFSATPYVATWVYTPDNGPTQLSFECRLDGPRGLTITPTKTGPTAGNWLLGEEPHIEPNGAWLVRFYYQ
jgi:hypothetical protein